MGLATKKTRMGGSIVGRLRRDSAGCPERTWQRAGEESERGRDGGRFPERIRETFRRAVWLRARKDFFAPEDLLFFRLLFD